MVLGFCCATSHFIFSFLVMYVSSYFVLFSHQFSPVTYSLLLYILLCLSVTCQIVLEVKLSRQFPSYIPHILFLELYSLRFLFISSLLPFGTFFCTFSWSSPGLLALSVYDQPLIKNEILVYYVVSYVIFLSLLRYAIKSKGKIMCPDTD